MKKDFVPGRWSERAPFLSNFAAILLSDPPAAGVSPQQAVDFDARAQVFLAANVLASDPSTRTSSSILARALAWRDAVSMLRALARQINASASVSAIRKNDLGLTPRRPRTRAIAAPTSKPVVTVAQIRNLQHVLRIRSESTPTRSARPYGTAGWEVWVKVCGPKEAEPLTIAECRYAGLATRVPHVVQFAAEDAGKTAWYLVRAVNPRGQAGPHSDQISSTIAA